MCWGDPAFGPPSAEEMTAALVDPEIGLCSHSARFTQADVVEHLCALSGGRLDLDEITALADRFLLSDLVVRLTPESEEGRRRPRAVVDRRPPGAGGPRPGPDRRPGQPGTARPSRRCGGGGAVGRAGVGWRTRWRPSGC